MSNDKQRILKDESPLVGVARVLRQHLTRLDGFLDTGGPESLTEEQIHSLRKTAKASRALWRLLKGTVTKAQFARFDQQIAAAARRFASTRERAVRAATFENVVREANLAPELIARVAELLSRPDAPPLNAGYGETPAAAEFERAQAAMPANNEQRLLEALPALQLPTKGQHRALVRALERTYRRGRRALEAAVEDSDPERLHDFRKLVKYHNNQLAILRRSKGLRERRRRLDSLAELLGQHHDLTVLAHHLRSAVLNELGTLDFSPLIAQLHRKQRDLAQEALAVGHSLYKRRPARATAWLAAHSPSLRSK